MSLLTWRWEKKKKNSSADRIREKKKIFLAREQKIVNAALELLISENIDRVTVSKIGTPLPIASINSFVIGLLTVTSYSFS